MNKQLLRSWCNGWSTEKSSEYHKPLIMGIVNVTPDSFSDGGLYFKPKQAVNKALDLIRQGADIIDIGGESSRPGARFISLDEERDRVLPVIEQLAERTDIAISIDTYKPELMAEAVDLGASMINDIKALQSPQSLEVAAKLNVPICLMHMQGNPENMQDNPQYETSPVDEINKFFSERLRACQLAGIDESRIILDPGFGFGKKATHNLQLIRDFSAFQCHHRPLLLGVSKKSTLGQIVNKEVEERLVAGVTMAVVAVLQGMAMIRTHDVLETHEAFLVLEALSSGAISKIKRVNA